MAATRFTGKKEETLTVPAPRGLFFDRVILLGLGKPGGLSPVQMQRLGGALVPALNAVGATSATTVLERRSEIGLMKALGASRRTVGAFFLAEQLLLALVGGIAGYAIGLELARVLGIGIFGIAPTIRLILFPIVLVLAAVVALLGSLVPLERASRVDPAPVLRGE